MSEQVTFTLSGSAKRVVAEGNWPRDNERGWQAVSSAPVRSAGVGTQSLVTMERADAEDLLGYLDSVAGVTADMTATERDGGQEGKAAARAARALRRALGAGV